MRFNKKTKRFIGAILLIAAVLLVFSLLVNKEEDYDRTFTTWTVGTVNPATGLYDELIENQMVSALIEVNDAIKIIPDYTAGVQFTVYAYDKDGKFIENIDLTEDCEATFVYDVVNADVHYVRIVLTPDDADGDINAVEKLIYATQLEIYTKTTNNK